MRTFEKSQKLNSVKYEIRGPVAVKANEMIDQGIDVLKLNIGNPAPFGFRAPQRIVDEMKAHLEENEGYSHSKGMPETRQAIYEYGLKKGLPNINTDEIFTGNGASELITMSLNALLNPGDEILVPAPDYPLWTGSVTLGGGTPVHYLCDEKSNWMPDIEDMKKKINSHTKGIVVINPNNPTGAVYPDEVLQQIADLAREHELILFSDEIYDRILMDGYEHHSLATFAPDVFTITFGGLSKSHFMCGFRIGWMILCGDRSKVKDYIAGLTLLASMRLCSNVPAQSVVKSCLEDKSELEVMLQPGGRIYEQREATINALNEIDGVSVVKPHGAFYCFPKLDVKKFNIHDDTQFAIDLLEQQHVLITSGTGFNWPDPDHFRIVMLPDVDTITAAMKGLAAFLADYHQK
ncbi:MAG: pyridoxal phosphate-dependent aminotransferase [Anaerovoracaceae bacterium]|nr:pyridoxal phosphate-dependent aminotransferase [Bacillota bacterium]MDY2670522.1 pyridoxal phosphate-dependent aminotransferase [Anaerovoracaceae bacterium]